MQIMSKKNDVSLIHTDRITISKNTKKVLKRNIASGNIFIFVFVLFFNSIEGFYLYWYLYGFCGIT